MNIHSLRHAGYNEPPPTKIETALPLSCPSATRFCARPSMCLQNAVLQRAGGRHCAGCGVAAGTVYLYFRSKDDLLVTIFERTVKAQSRKAAATAAVADPAERLRRFAQLHLSMLGRDRKLAIVFQVELRQSLKFMERFSSTLLRDYLDRSAPPSSRVSGKASSART